MPFGVSGAGIAYPIRCQMPFAATRAPKAPNVDQAGHLNGQ